MAFSTKAQHGSVFTLSCDPETFTSVVTPGLHAGNVVTGKPTMISWEQKLDSRNQGVILYGLTCKPGEKRPRAEAEVHILSRATPGRPGMSVLSVELKTGDWKVVAPQVGQVIDALRKENLIVEK